MRPPPGPSDATPAAPSTDRDAAFERDVLRCLPDVARFARALTHDPSDADDLVQETFLQAYRGYHTFRPGHDARRWLFTICRHAHTRQRTRDARLVESEDGSDAEFETLLAVRGHAAARRAGEDTLFERLDLGPAIDAALAALPEVFRLAVVLVDMEGQSYEEAAAVQGVPVGTIRSRLFRARRLLQERLLEFGRDAGYVATHTRPGTRHDPRASPAPSTSTVPLGRRREAPHGGGGPGPSAGVRSGISSSEPPATSDERPSGSRPTTSPPAEDPIT